VLYLSGHVRPDLPAMLTPRMRQAPPTGQPWAADNGRYAAPHEYTDAGYLGWLAKHAAAADRCLFATAPDVVGDAAATLALSAPMYGHIRALGYRVALVAQDGLEHLHVPWAEIDALFIGGTTAWKLGEAAHQLAAQARALGKHVHMGRVNSLRRLRLARDMGCDSVDGTYLAFGPDINARRLAGWQALLAAQPTLGMEGSE
jgi:hypothetical protein